MCWAIEPDIREFERKICEYAALGASFVQELSVVGSWSAISVGAVVIEAIPKGVVALRVPAKAIKRKQ